MSGFSSVLSSLTKLNAINWTSEAVQDLKRTALTAPTTVTVFCGSESAVQLNQPLHVVTTITWLISGGRG